MRKWQQDGLCHWRPSGNEGSVRSWALVSDSKACPLTNSAAISSSASLPPCLNLLVNSEDILYHKAIFGALVLIWETCDRMNSCVNMALSFSSYEFFLFMSINNLGTNSLWINHFMNNWYNMCVNPNATYRVSIF